MFRIFNRDGKTLLQEVNGSNLRGACLYGASLDKANLYGADLNGANLGDAGLSDADLRYADLRGTNLRGTYLRGADLRQAIGICDAGYDRRGYHFIGVLHDDGWRVAAGCRWFTIPEAIAHWTAKGNKGALARVAVIQAGE